MTNDIFIIFVLQSLKITQGVILFHSYYFYAIKRQIAWKILGMQMYKKSAF